MWLIGYVSVTTTIILVLLLILPIAMIIIGSYLFSYFNTSVTCVSDWMTLSGAVKLDDCPNEKFIPRWLLIMGCFGLLKNVLSLSQQVRTSHVKTILLHNFVWRYTNCSQIFHKARDDNDKQASKNPFECILDLFLFAWFIAGSSSFCLQSVRDTLVEGERISTLQLFGNA